MLANSKFTQNFTFFRFILKTIGTLVNTIECSDFKDITEIEREYPSCMVFNNFEHTFIEQGKPKLHLHLFIFS